MIHKKGQTLGLAILSGLFVFMVGMLAINFLMSEINDFRINMQCSSPATISDGTKVLCLIVDTTVPYWILLAFSILVGAITARLAI